MIAAWLAACRGPDGPGGPAEPGLADNFGVAETEGTEGCDNLLPECLFPFPSDAYVGADGLHLPVLLYDAFDPTPIADANRAFGAASPIVFQLGAAVAPGEPFDSAPSVGPDWPTVLVDADTGELVPHWVEPDYLSPNLDPPVLILRPAVSLPRGHEVVVGVRRLVDADGELIEAPEAFAALRDGQASRWIGVHARRQRFEDTVFPTLEAAGFAREELQLAWSFPVQSDADATEPLLSVRDAVFAALPTAGPAYHIDAITVCDGVDDDPACHPAIAVIVDGTASIPSAVGPADALGLRLVNRDADGHVFVDGVEEWPFRLQLPRVAFDGPEPVPVLQYGHGLLGSAGEADADWLRTLAERQGFAILATDMEGMNEAIVPVWFEVLFGDGGRFGQLQDLALQGVVNQLVDQRLVATTLAEDPDPRLRRADGRLAWDPAVVWYYGNSQGGSVGTLVTATSLDVERGVLGVPGSGYPLLLHRSTGFEPFVGMVEAVYPHPAALPTFLALLGTGWDQSDPLTFAPHLRASPLPGTAAKDVLYHVAKEDQQVVNEASFISARAAGATVMVPAVRPVFGLPEEGYPASPGVALVEVDFGVPDDPTPLDPADGDASLPDDGDTHGWLREWGPTQDQLVHFLQTGEVVDVCGGAPCFHDGPP